MRVTHLACLILCAAIRVLGQQPGISEIENGSNFGASALVAQGSIISIYGNALGPNTLVHALSLPLTNVLPNDTTATSVQITSGGAIYNAWILYTSYSQVGAIVPSNVPLGAAAVTVTSSKQVSSSVTVTIVAANFGIFTKNSAGYGPASIQNYVSASSTPANALTASAQPGQVVILYGTGLGAALDGKDNVAPKVGNIGTNVVVTVAGIPVTPLYAGRSSQYPGLDQINFQIPTLSAAARTVAPIPQLAGCYVPVAVGVGGIVSNIATVSISQTNVCSHPLGLNAAALAKLDGGGSVNIGAALVTRQNTGPLVQSDGVTAVFQAASADMAFTLASTYGGNASALPPVLCASSVAPLKSELAGGIFVAVTAFEPVDLEVPGYYDAGSPLALVLPAAGTNPQTAISLTQNATFPTNYTMVSSYCLSFGCDGPTFLAGGPWALNAPGGADVSAFSANFTVPTMPQWTNAEAFDGQVIPRSNNLTVTWTGGDPNDVMLISGYAEIIDLAHSANSTAQSFTCSVPVSLGSYTVPAAVLTNLLAAPAPSPTIAYGGTLSLSTGATTNFTAQFRASGNLDAGAITWNYTSMRVVNWQ